MKKPLTDSFSARKAFRFSTTLLLGVMLGVPAALGQSTPVPLGYQRVGNLVVLSWTNATFSLQSAPSIHGTFTLVPGATSPHTNLISSAQNYFRLLAIEPPAGMALIPAGNFMMGNAFSGEGFADELPLHDVHLSPFFLDKYEVTKGLWDEVKAWSEGAGYAYDNTEAGKATNHPVHSVGWYDAVKWCNARSQRAGLVPCYYTDEGLTEIYKTEQVIPRVKWDANGYRLPTEAEWEKAARGGAGGRRFPWSDSDSIQHSRANYISSTVYAYDTSPTRGYHPDFQTGEPPFTSQVDYFPANGYGLHDMAGNVWEWCWDWSSSTYYSSSPPTDPRGPDSGGFRVIRGGGWSYHASSSRIAIRLNYNPASGNNFTGFRCARRVDP